MQDPKKPLADEFSTPKLKKKKPLTQKAPLFPQQGNSANGTSPLPVKAGHNGTKRNMKNEVSPSFQQQPERMSSDSLPDSSPSGSGYRALRLKYLLLEEESFALGRDLREVEDEVKTLEDEKHALLDKLIVLEGLVDPSELQPQGVAFIVVYLSISLPVFVVKFAHL